MNKFFVLLSLSLIGLGGCPSYQTSLTEKQWKKIVQENSELSAKEIPHKARIIPLSKDKIWIDFNHDKLCGIRHCLYAIYQVNSETEQANLQWRSYLYPMLPPSIPLMQKGKNNCIFIHQRQEKQVEKYELCPQNGQYKITQKIVNGG
ncbi:hypothetical protein [Crocosphaera watsonii]|uniref:Lipoprotein n=1 Tax=Crocosphaera watsonii WH 0005 TaxID=423472 RepID=T2IPP5_CROWT|nr:hypothetical protein [Crocosphaera watsonii]MCH2231573.1 hypothetical protein [Crocinitomicaceae bacterium]CCQ54894.1 hypothetical protein CWATWH0005_5834 [Crocosphaera watsonii WH 0005]